MTIDPKLTCGAVALIVTDLDRSLRYYEHNIGLRVRRQEGRTAWLGVDGRDLLQLSELRGARPVQRGHTGLYHFAILTPSRFELSRTLHHLVATDTSIDGASDHGVSEALYLTDPDGHGIEIYRDRPRAEWPKPGGRLNMTVDPLDARGLLAETVGGNQAWAGLHRDTVIGHVHLHVADLRDAEQFYVGALGMDLMQRFGNQALFVAAGGYHHHLGLNVWAGWARRRRRATLRGWTGASCGTLRRQHLAATVAQLEAAQVPVVAEEGRWWVYDPARNLVLLSVMENEQ